MCLIYIVLITTGLASCSVFKNAAENKIARPNGSSGRAFADNIVVALWQSSDMFYLAGKNKH